MSKPQTCDDCSLTWDRKGNVKDVVLCPLHAAGADLLAALEASLIARIEAAKRRSHEETRFCARCGMTCEILHKTRTFEFDDGKQVSWHNATGGDCWGQEEHARAAIAQAKLPT